MKHITVTGPLHSAAAQGRKLYTEHTEQGLHTLLDAPGGIRNSLPERRVSAADVLISVRPTAAGSHEDIIAKAMSTARDALGTLWMSFSESDNNAIVAKDAIEQLESAIEVHTQMHSTSYTTS